jgi:uncharacterized protein
VELPTSLPLRTGWSLTRESEFSYQCRGCGRCCYGKAIPVNPYEIARLAEVLGTTTTDVLARCTTTGGAILAARPDDACIFLGERGCSVHQGRPLACRLYPLGLLVTPDGDERFAEVVPHPESAGVYGAAPERVEDWLRGQGAGPYLAASRRYAAVLRRLLAVLAGSEEATAVRAEASAAMERAPRPEDETWLDVDAVVARRCAARGEPMPDDLTLKVEMHLAALEELADGLEE